MPFVSIPLQSTDQTITRLSVKSILEQFVFLTRLNIPLTDFIYKEKGGVNKTFQSNDRAEPLQMASRGYIMVEYDEVIDLENSIGTVHSNSYQPIINLPLLGIHGSPIHTPMKLTMDITIRLQSLNELKEWLFQLRRDFVKRVPANTHDLQFHYTIPPEIVNYLSNVHTATNTVDPLGMSVDEFIVQYMASGVHIRHSLNDVSRQLVMNVKQTGCVAYFSGLPESITSEQTDNFSELTFKYDLVYEKPTHLQLYYQSFVHNQRIPIDMLQRHANRIPTDPPQYGAPSTFMYQFPEPSENKYHAYPEDTWIPPNTTHDTTPLIVAPIQIDETDVTRVIDLNVLSDNPVYQAALTLITENNFNITKRWDSPFFLEYWEVTDVARPVVINMNEQLLVTVDQPANLRARHYLQFSRFNDLSMVSLTDLRKKPLDLFEILKPLHPELILRPTRGIDDIEGNGDELITLGGQTYITEKSVTAVIKRIKTTQVSYRYHYNIPHPLWVNNIAISMESKHALI